MSEREIEIRLRVEVPVDADASTAERLLMDAGRKAVQEALQEVAQDAEIPRNCPRCKKGGQSGTDG